MGKPNPFCRPQSRPGESLPTTTTTTTVSPEDTFVIPVSGASCPKVDDTVTTTTVSPGDDITINLPCATTTSTTTTTTVPGTPTNQSWYLKYTAPYNGFINNIVRNHWWNTHIASIVIDYGDITPASNDQPKSLILTSLNNANSWSSRNWPYYISNNTIKTIDEYGTEPVFIMHNDTDPASDKDMGLFYTLLDKKDWYAKTPGVRGYSPSNSAAFSCFIEGLRYESSINRYTIYGAGIDKYGNILKIDNYNPLFSSFSSEYSVEIIPISSLFTEPFIFGTVSQNRVSSTKYLIPNGNHCFTLVAGFTNISRFDWPIYSFSVCHNGNYWIAVGKRSQTSNEQICAISYDDGQNWSIISTITNNTTLHTSIYGLSNLVLINGGLYCFSETRMYRSFNGGFNWDSVALPENGGAFPAIAADTGNTGKIVVGIKNKIYTYE